MLRKFLGLCSVLAFTVWGAVANAGLIEVVADGGFEGGSPNDSWVQTSTNFGTPICTIQTCGTGGGTSSPYSGNWWAWFGGIAADEASSLSQDVVIPVGKSATLSFYHQVLAANATNAFLEVSLGGSTIFSDPSNTTTGPYSLLSFDVSGFADGGTHTLMFSFFSEGGTTNHNVDAVSLQVAAAPAPVPAPATLAIFGLGLAMLGCARRRRG